MAGRPASGAQTIRRCPNNPAVPKQSGGAQTIRRCPNNPGSAQTTPAVPWRRSANGPVPSSPCATDLAGRASRHQRPWTWLNSGVGCSTDGRAAIVALPAKPLPSPPLDSAPQFGAPAAGLSIAPPPCAPPCALPTNAATVRRHVSHVFTPCGGHGIFLNTPTPRVAP